MNDISRSIVKMITLKDGRKLSYAEYGDNLGIPVISFHGMPGSRLVFRVMDKAAAAAGAHMIAPDRPGYGYSTPYSQGSLLEYVDDVLEMADALGKQHFAVLGISGQDLLHWLALIKFRAGSWMRLL